MVTTYHEHLSFLPMQNAEISRVVIYIESVFTALQIIFWNNPRDKPKSSMRVGVWPCACDVLICVNMYKNDYKKFVIILLSQTHSAHMKHET